LLFEIECKETMQINMLETNRALVCSILRFSYGLKTNL